MLSPADVAVLSELCALVDDGCSRILVGLEGEDDGDAGGVTVCFGSVRDRRESRPVTVSVDLYSLLIGGTAPDRFGGMGEALDAVRRWHQRVRARLCWACSGRDEHEPACPQASDEAVRL
jgi:hypothetical protein